MKPKEKAEKLFYDYLTYFPEFRNDLEYDYNVESAKNCALIAVDELLNISLPSSEYGGVITDATIEYWNEVKQEIEKL